VSLAEVEIEQEQFQSSLRETARDLLEREGGTKAARAALEGDAGPTERLHDQIAELGWAGVEVPEEHGGVGAGFGSLCVILHELGRVAAPGPYASTAVLAIPAVVGASADQQARWLPPLAAGELKATAVLTGPGGIPDELGIAARADGDGWRLEGEVGFVPDAETADELLVAAELVDGAGVGLFLVAAGAEGLAITGQPSVDRTRRLGQVALTGVDVRADRCLAVPGAAEPLLAKLRARAALAAAADAVGGAERALELTVEYLGQRRQFERPIGSFQALKHRCADMFLALEASRTAVAHAARALERSAPATAAVSIAKSYAGDAFVRIAGEGVQLHGGIGFTWEHDMHVYLKRARLDQASWGSSLWHRDQLAELLLGHMV
jgi:alkylation response protein AidB-like acyl-CoA dehydrogenase